MEVGEEEVEDLYERIYQAENNNDDVSLQRIFRLISTKDLNTFTIDSPTLTLLMMLLSQFDLDDMYPNHLINLFDSPHVDPKRLHINQQDLGNGKTALMYAASRGHVELGAKLLSWGADVGIKTPNNLTALHLACLFAEIEMFRLLTPLCPDEQFDFKLNDSGFTFRDEVKMRRLVAPKYREMLLLIDEERARRGMLDLRWEIVF